LSQSGSSEGLATVSGVLRVMAVFHVFGIASVIPRNWTELRRGATGQVQEEAGRACAVPMLALRVGPWSAHSCVLLKWR
jgi:hypothetical protein